MKKEKNYHEPECTVTEISSEGILCSSQIQTEVSNEAWEKQEDYLIFK